MKLFTLSFLIFLGFSSTAQVYELGTTFCNTTVAQFNSSFKANTYGSVEDEYTFRFEDQANLGVFVEVVRTTNVISLTIAGFSTLGAIYNVDVKAKVGGVYNNYGNVCTIAAPGSLPTTQLGGCITAGNNPVSMAVFNSAFKCGSVAGATEYEFEFTDQGTSAVTTVVNSKNSMSLAKAGLYSPSAIYDVRVKTKVNGIDSPYGGICQVKAPANLPFTTLNSTFCGAQLTFFGQNFKADNLAGATEYEFRFEDKSNLGVFITATSTSNIMTLITAGITTPFAGFNVTVRAKLGNSVPAVYTNYGAACDLFTPTTVPLIKLDGTSCGLQTNEYSDLITCETVPSALNYRFMFEDISNPGVAIDSITVPTNSTSLFDLLGNDTVPNTTYNVSVKAEISSGYGIYGPTCKVFSKQTIPTPELHANWCGGTLTSFAQKFYSTTVPNATEYTFSFVDVTVPGSPGTPIVIVNNNQFGKLSTFGLLTPDAVYEVEVKAQVGGAYGAFGNKCNLTAPSIPSSGLTASLCGATLSAFNSKITTASVGGATDYTFRFDDGNGNVTLHETNFHTTNLVKAGLLDVGAVYTVDVRAKVNGTYGVYGASCTLNAPVAVPTTQLIASDCGITVPSFGNLLYATSVAGASEYAFEFFESGSLSTHYDTTTFHTTSFAAAGVTTPGTAYTIKVKANVGGTWGQYGTICTVTTPSQPSMVLNSNSNQNAAGSSIIIDGSLNGENTPTNVELSVYPNPSSELVTIATNLSTYNVSIYSATGNLVYTSSVRNPMHKVILDDYANGLYIVHVSNTEGIILKTEKLFVVK